MNIEDLLITPFLISNAHFTGQKNKKNVKSMVGICSLRITYDGLTFSSSFCLFEDVKDEI